MSLKGKKRINYKRLLLDIQSEDNHKYEQIRELEKDRYE